MNCPACNSKLKKVPVTVQGATKKVVSFQCASCHYFEFEQRSSAKVIEELRDQHLKIKHKIIKLSKDRLGIYFNSNIIRSLGLRKGEELYISIPDKKRMLIELVH